MLNTQLPLIVWIFAVIGFAIVLYAVPNFQDKGQFTTWATLVVLMLTLVVLVWYAHDTHRIADQTVEASLRPLILRSGQIVDWHVLALEDMQENENFEPTLEFTNHKNIAMDIEGYIVINNRKYNLVFRGNVRGSIVDVDAGRRVVFNQKWGWLSPETNVVASYSKNEFVETEEKNQIYLSYKDIEGNQYFTKEDENFYQTSGKN